MPSVSNFLWNQAKKLGAAINYKIPEPFVQRTQKHVRVTGQGVGSTQYWRDCLVISGANSGLASWVEMNLGNDINPNLTYGLVSLNKTTNGLGPTGGRGVHRGVLGLGAVDFSGRGRPNARRLVHVNILWVLRASGEGLVRNEDQDVGRILQEVDMERPRRRRSQNVSAAGSSSANSAILQSEDTLSNNNSSVDPPVYYIGVPVAPSNPNGAGAGGIVVPNANRFGVSQFHPPRNGTSPSDEYVGSVATQGEGIPAAPSNPFGGAGGSLLTRGEYSRDSSIFPGNVPHFSCRSQSNSPSPITQTFQSEEDVY